MFPTGLNKFWQRISKSLYQTDANTVEQVNGDNPQQLLIYNRKKSSINYERGYANWVGNVFKIGTDAGGNGVGRLLNFVSSVVGNTTLVSIDTAVTDSLTTSLFSVSRTAAGTYTYGFYPNRTDRGLLISTGTAATNISGPGHGYITIHGVLYGPSSIALSTVAFTVGHDVNWPGPLTVGASTTTPIGTDMVAATITVRGYAAKPAATVNLVGGTVSIFGGVGASSSAGAAHGGNVTLAGGAGYGTGTKGIVTASRLLANGFATAASAKTADYTATLDDSTIEVDATSAAVTITLFATSGNAGNIIVVKKTDASANAVTVDANASETIDGATTLSLASQYSTCLIQVNAAGTGWNKLSGI